ncbi:MAG: polysaccharide deacetylase family protein, partial [Acidimicrobiaceae bacterium]|nr:polysaccharide deacetylase family protein [Acidimicrobiaceae bacterium]
ISPPAVPDDGPVVDLTFDDGPHPTYTPQVLDVLARHGVRATFFVVGWLAERYPLLIQRIAHEGHTLANHSWSHESLARVSKSAFDRSVGRTQEILGPLATPCLRPPYYAIGRFTEEWSNELGLRLVGWTYSPRDWEQRPARAIADGIVARTFPGAIILLHDGGGPRSATVRGLDMALERLSDRGFEFKPLCR